MLYQVNDIITIGIITYTIMIVQKVVRPDPKALGHTQLYLKRASNKVIYTAYIHNDETLTRVETNGSTW